MWYIIGTEAVIAVKELFQQPATDVNPIHHWRDLKNQWERPKKKQQMAISYHHGFNCHFLSRSISTSRAPCSTLRLHEHRLLGPMVDVLLRYGYGPKFDTLKIGCLISNFPYLMIYYVSSTKPTCNENCPFIIDLPIKKCDFP